MDEELAMRAAKLQMAMMLLKQETKNVHVLMAKIADKLELSPCDIDIVYYSDCLETAIAVAETMGVTVEIDDFFETMKEAIETKKEQLKKIESNP